MDNKQQTKDKVIDWIDSCDTIEQLNCLIDVPVNFLSLHKDSILADEILYSFNLKMSELVKTR